MTKEKKPNIVYILADDMGYGDLSCLNENSRIPTPCLDELATEGMIFTDGHSCSAVCTPSRYGILTGRYAFRTRLKKGVLNGFEPHLIEEGRETVPSYLKRHGYHTACIGKWHLGMDYPTTDGEPASKERENTDWTGQITNGPNACGFDLFYGIPNSLGNTPYIWIENDRFIGTCTTTKGFEEPGPAEEDFNPYEAMPNILEKSIEFIENQNDNTPFFLYMPLTAPHTPLVPTPPFQGKSPIGPYGDFCMQVDWTVGEIMNALKQKGLEENTLVVFTSDNGCAPYIGVENFEALGHFPSYIYRGYKADIWEGGHRIPLIMRWPGQIKPGSVCDEMVNLNDLLATCAAIIGEPLVDDAGEDSYDILPLMQGTGGSRPEREAMVHHSIEGNFSIRKGDWKLELCPGSGGWTSPTNPEAKTNALPEIQLYNLKTDIAEQTNLAAAHPQIVAELKALLDTTMRDGRSVPADRSPDRNAGRIASKQPEECCLVC